MFEANELLTPEKNILTSLPEETARVFSILIMTRQRRREKIPQIWKGANKTKKRRHCARTVTDNGQRRGGGGAKDPFLPSLLYL